jgi:hypothetical protein
MLTKVPFYKEQILRNSLQENLARCYVNTEIKSFIIESFKFLLLIL